MANKYEFAGSKNSGAVKWYMQRITGIVLVVLLVGHYILMHATPDSGHTYHAVMLRLQSPVWKIIDLSFITLGLWHGLNGTWNVIRDHEMSAAVSMTLYTLLIISGLAFWFLGINTILSF
jgi:succinate dehydrogenase / fumarate reductase membrane anchor subunit